MPYIAEKPKLHDDSNVLRARIPGWGVDIDPRDRPAVPKEKFDLSATGAHWQFPERQIETWPRERSTEHRFLTPVFGTVCPPRGLSGVIRRYAYTFSEGRLAHWTLLMLGDRIDVLESRITGLLRGRPDTPRELGLRAEIKRHGIRSRVGRHRADLIHLPIDVLMFTVPRIFAIVGAAKLIGAVTRGVQRRQRRRSIIGRLLHAR
ncbi:MAG: hypothetical protein JWO86_9062 [Myxococcaceae bacterium]|nr:hypothetical protein [Myxococcaceae bacterium]MEA2749361.1 hypothetical protein [Myxococcales bacterium]